MKKRPSAAAVVSSEILIDVDDNFDDQSRSSEIEVARVVSSLQVDVPRQKGPFLVDDGSSRTVSTANSTPVATSLAHLSVLSANFTALPGRTQNLQHDEEDIDDDDSSRFPAWLSLRGRATRDDDSIAPSTVCPSATGDALSSGRRPFSNRMPRHIDVLSNACA